MLVKKYHLFCLAIYGDNFCSSGQQAFKIITSNVLRVAAINSVGDFVLFLGKVLVVTLTVLVGFTMLEVIYKLFKSCLQVILVGRVINKILKYG